MSLGFAWVAPVPSRMLGRYTGCQEMDNLTKDGWRSHGQVHLSGQGQSALWLLLRMASDSGLGPAPAGGTRDSGREVLEAPVSPCWSDFPSILSSSVNKLATAPEAW